VARGWTQREVAERTGYTERYLRYVESLTFRPPARVASALAEAFGVSVPELLTWLRPADPSSDQASEAAA
jgi:transcriptional regulator with XRE-family HTH domain